MGLRYRVPLPGPFYYSGHVGPKRRLPRSSNTGTGPMGFVVKGLGESLSSDWHRVLRFVIARGGGHDHMRPIIRCSGGDGLTTSWTNAPKCGGRLTSVVWTGEQRRPIVKTIGSKTAPSRTGQTPHSTTKTMEKEGTP